MVVGGGIAGIEAALKLAATGKKVYLVEKDPSIGGHMAMFDKTFPTLDCAACILTPKMSAAGKDPNIEMMAYSEVTEVDGYVGNFKVKVKKKARYVDTDTCTGCGACQDVCVVRKVKSEFDAGTGLSQRDLHPLPAGGAAARHDRSREVPHALHAASAPSSPACLPAAPRRSTSRSRTSTSTSRSAPSSWRPASSSGTRPRSSATATAASTT